MHRNNWSLARLAPRVFSFRVYSSPLGFPHDCQEMLLVDTRIKVGRQTTTTTDQKGLWTLSLNDSRGKGLWTLSQNDSRGKRGKNTIIRRRLVVGHHLENLPVARGLAPFFLFFFFDKCVDSLLFLASSAPSYHDDAFASVSLSVAAAHSHEPLHPLYQRTARTVRSQEQRAREHAWARIGTRGIDHGDSRALHLRRSHAP